MPSLCWSFLVWLPVLATAGILDALKSVVNSVKDTVGDHDVEIKVDSHTWTRTISIEAMQRQSVEGWCSEKPNDAYGLTVAWKDRGTRKVEQRIANGQAYTYTEVVDYYAPEKRLAEDGASYAYKEFTDYYGKEGRGDTKWIEATISEQPDVTKMANENWAKATKQECKGDCCPNCYEEKYSDFWCEYTIDRWTWKNDVTASENNAYPYWPDVQLQQCEATAPGCERKGASTESFKVELTMIEKGNDAQTHCSKGNIDFAQWQLLEVGQRYPAKRRLAYGLLCGSIEIPGATRKRRVANDGKPYTYDEFINFFGRSAVGKWQAAPWAKNEEL